MLRLRNIHPELNGMDLSNLLSTIAPVDFVKFDPRNETMAYVCFQQNCIENNKKAIQKFDGKKAMGNTLVVESAASLADRISIASGPSSRSKLPESGPRAREQPRARARAKVTKAKAEKTRNIKVKKTAEDLDSELAAYMNAASGETAPQEPFAAQNNGEAMME